MVEDAGHGPGAAPHRLEEATGGIDRRAEGQHVVEVAEQLVTGFPPDVPGGDEAMPHQVLTAVRSSVVLHRGFRPFLVLPLPKDAFPKTGLGEIQCSLTRQRPEPGAYETEAHAATELTTRVPGGHTPPEDATEQALCEIYAEVLDVAPGSLSAGAAFFDLGGTSLDILRLRSKVTERLGATDLEISTLLRALTVRALAQPLTRAAVSGTPEYDPVVPMQTNGTKTPLLCARLGVSEILVFVNLVKCFVGGRPPHGTLPDRRGVPVRVHRRPVRATDTGPPLHGGRPGRRRRRLAARPSRREDRD
ncbi:phosphopantetheine-binding protein [Streptomyces sp. NPDC044984]|uniref:acyl carrier protein n=1 Tax=Streptomyces sp. NPDC044984 TaxID=3154335 RepID=UPI0033CCDCD2